MLRTIFVSLYRLYIPTFVYHIGGEKRSIDRLSLDDGGVSGVASTSCKCHHRVNYN